MIAEQYPGLLDRTDEEKLQLAGELWNDVIGDAAEADDPGIISLMESRLAEYRAHPERVSSWEDVRARLLALRQ